MVCCPFQKEPKKIIESDHSKKHWFRLKVQIFCCPNTNELFAKSFHKKLLVFLYSDRRWHHSCSERSTNSLICTGAEVIISLRTSPGFVHEMHILCVYENWKASHCATYFTPMWLSFEALPFTTNSFIESTASPENILLREVLNVNTVHRVGIPIASHVPHKPTWILEFWEKKVAEVFGFHAPKQTACTIVATKIDFLLVFFCHRYFLFQGK